MRSPHTFFSHSLPLPNSLSQPPGEEGVWYPGESLARGTESVRGRWEGELTRDGVGRVRNPVPYATAERIPYPPRAPVQPPAPPSGGGAIPGNKIPGKKRLLPPRSPPPRVGLQESPKLTSCLPRSDESPPLEALVPGTLPPQGRRLPWPAG